MSLSMSQAALPAFKTALGALAGLIDKMEAFAAAKKIDPAVLLAWRIAPDMFPLVRQIQLVGDMAKNGAARLAGLTPPRFEDTETTIPELKARVAKTLAFLDTIDPAAVDAAATREIVFPMGGKQAHMAGPDYLSLFILPNMYFHLTATYLILRGLDVEIGKPDFLGNIPLTKS